MRYFMKALQIMGLVSTWSVTALEDGKVTVSEGTALIEGICKILDVTHTNLGVLLYRVRNRLRECLEARGVRKP